MTDENDSRNEAFAFEKYLISNPKKRDVPRKAWELYQEGLDALESVGIAKHPERGFAVIGTFGQGPVIIWQESKESSMYPVEHNLPISESFRGGNARKYPFYKMAVGDSIFIPISDLKQSINPSHCVSSAANNFGRRHNRIFIVRQVLDPTSGDIIGYRAWRKG